MGDLIGDFRFALTGLGKNPGFAVAAIVSVAVGIGTNAAVFSILNGVLLRPLPVAEPTQLVRIGLARQGAGFMGISFPEYRDLRSSVSALSGVLVHSPQPIVLSVGSEPEEPQAHFVSRSSARPYGWRGFVVTRKGGRAVAETVAERSAILWPHAEPPGALAGEHVIGDLTFDRCSSSRASPGCDWLLGRQPRHHFLNLSRDRSKRDGGRHAAEDSSDPRLESER